jgi:siroheme synthase-like protein
MPANLLPIFVKLADRPCLVVGAGEIAASKIASLVQSGARIAVIAPRANPEVQNLAANGKLQWSQREFAAADLDGIFLVIAATSDAEVNRAVFEEAQRRGILCNSVDDPPHCDFYFAAVVRRGDLQIAISTAGESPAVAQRLRRQLDETLDESVGDWLRLVGALRREIMATHTPSEDRKRLLHLLAYIEFVDSEDGSERTLKPPSLALHLEPHNAETLTNDSRQGTASAVPKGVSYPRVLTPEVQSTIGHPINQAGSSYPGVKQ